MINTKIKSADLAAVDKDLTRLELQETRWSGSLVGPSGCGKSTLLYLLGDARTVRPFGGA